MIFLMLALTLMDSPKVAPYGIAILQNRTLFAKNEKVVISLRLLNNSPRELKAKYFPNILKPLKVEQDGVALKPNEAFAEKEMFPNIEYIRLNGHIDRKVDLELLYPEMKKGGVFQLSYVSENVDFQGKPIRISKVDLPDLKSIFRLKTSMGDMDMVLHPEEAPNHAKNFAILVAEGFYTNMIFHRVVRGFVIQTGDPKGDGSGGSGFPLNVEWSPFLKHHHYAVGMARTEERDSADSQFYICLGPDKELNKDYTVFGDILAGKDVVDAIGMVGTTGNYGNPPNKPFDDVTLNSIEILPPPSK